MKRFEEYVEAYENAMREQDERTRTVFSPPKWIFYKWCEDEGIEEFSDPTLEEKLQKTKESDERLGIVLEKGLAEIDQMFQFLSFAKEKPRKGRKNKE